MIFLKIFKFKFYILYFIKRLYMIGSEMNILTILILSALLI